MSLNDTPVSERIQIGFFGCTNSGKSSLINAISGQEVAVVSEKKGTTTDPVTKTMELGELGPVVLIDTPGLDDDTEIGELRIKRANEMFERTDIAVIVSDAQDESDDNTYTDKNKNDFLRISVVQEIRKKCIEKNKPYIIVVNKSDLLEKQTTNSKNSSDTLQIPVSALTGLNINKLKEEIIAKGLELKNKRERKIVSDLINEGDTVILVIPIDESAPKGRLILPQQQVIRDILESGGNALCIKDSELEDFFKKNVNITGGMRPSLVITDSQVFSFVSAIVPEDIPLTSFSILMARYKGSLKAQIDGAKAIDSLEDGDKVLIAEGCTHHRQCDDIGTVKLPKLLKKYTGKDIIIEASSGHGYPDELGKYKLILHCGGCMLGEAEVQSRMQKAMDECVPVTNYGVAIAYMNGILERSISVCGYKFR